MIPHYRFIPVFLAGASLFGVRAMSEESRAAWWLRADGVQPVADLQNRSQPGQDVKFVDRLGRIAVIQEGDALILRGTFEPNIWRFDTTTFDSQFDMKRLYVTPNSPANPDPSSLWSAAFRQRFGEDYATTTGPWEIYNGKWLVPTARVALDGKHVYTSWFDLPSLEDQAAGRVYASFALDIREAGEHTVRISFTPFAYNTRAARGDRPNQAKVETEPNPLKPDQIASIAVGIDERTKALRPIRLKPELAGKHPRMSGTHSLVTPEKLLAPNDPEVQRFIISLDPDQGENWEYSLSEESMASDNDMDMGKKLSSASVTYDQTAQRLSPDARKAVDEMFIKRADGFYTFCVFQRNYHPTGYAQNHASCAQAGLIFAGLAFDGPLAEKWLNLATAIYSKRVELLGRDGSVEFMNEGRGYGLGFWQNGVDALKRMTGADLAVAPFFANEWRFAMHHSPSFEGYVYAKFPVPVPDGVTPGNLPADWHFEDAGQVFMRSNWTEETYRAQLWAGPPFGHQGTPLAKRYNFAHYQVNQGSFTLTKGKHDIISEPNATRDYRKSATGANTLIINGTDQWGGGQVWHPKLATEQFGRIACFADNGAMSWARADLKGAYPPSARIRALSRVLVHLKPDYFLIFDRLETEGPAEAEWRFHAGVIEPPPPGNRFACFGYTFNREGKTHQESFLKIPGVSAQVAFLHPSSVRATLGFTEMFFRWRPDRPTQHLKVQQRSEEGCLQLLTTFGPDVDLKPIGDGGRAFQHSRESLTWTVLIGPGQLGPLGSDAFFTVAVHDAKTQETRLARWGGASVSYDGAEVKEKAPDFLTVLSGGKTQRTETAP